jgi:hypothetical protein
MKTTIFYCIAITGFIAMVGCQKQTNVTPEEAHKTCTKHSAGSSTPTATISDGRWN